MRNPVLVLNSLETMSKIDGYTFKRLYRNLYNYEFYLKAYEKIYAKTGNMTEGTDGKTIDGMSIERIQNIMESIKTESYKPRPAKRTYIPKKNGSKRPLGIPSIDDKLVQEIVRNILESIFENKFSNNSHGFRPNRSCHTALIQCKQTLIGTKWFVEGDIKGFFDNIDHQILINILRKHIKDEKFIRLIWKFLKAGYLEDWRFHKTNSGTPQGGIISPILSNIYLNELDSMIEEYKENFDMGKGRKTNNGYMRFYKKIFSLKKQNEQDWYLISSDEQERRKREIQGLYQTLNKLNRLEPMDTQFKRIKYVRYADDFIIGIIGSKKDAENVKEDLTVFLKDRLNLELSQEKTLITHNSKPARFLGYDIKISSNQSAKSSKDWKNKTPRRSVSGKCFLYMPKEKWINKLIELNALRIVDGKRWKPQRRPHLLNLEDLEILSVYNSEIHGFYNYYKLAINVSSLHAFNHIMKFSMAKTFSNKYGLTTAQVFKKYNKNGKFTIQFETKKGTKERVYYDKGFRKSAEINKGSSVDMDEKPNTFIYSSRSSLIQRLLANKCEWCGTENVAIEVHHVRSLIFLTW
ncbi:reverse transcriptase domain-containing protein [Mycolicibacterium elephantis]|uniref:reverse transcriptase domain-containing protein n=1 Tax=Mycolicibacterium elephantis TaxID=81858 RepID=UPI003A89D9A8